MKKNTTITLDQTEQKVETIKNNFWNDVKDVQKKLEKRDLKHKTKRPDYCIHNTITTKQ